MTVINREITLDAIVVGDLILALDLQITTLLKRAEYQQRLNYHEDANRFIRRAADCTTIKRALQEAVPYVRLIAPTDTEKREPL